MPNKKYLLLGWGVITAILIGIVIWQFGINPQLDKIAKENYSKGVEAGKVEASNIITNQLCTFGKMEWTLPINNGKCEAGAALQKLDLIPQIKQ